MMSWPEAENLKEHILFYKRELNRLKVPNPELMSCKIKEVSRNKYLLVMREEKLKDDRFRKCLKIKRLVINNI